MKDYIIKNETYAIIATLTGSKIITETGIILSKNTPKEIIDNNCLYYGSSLTGRMSGTKYLLGINYKVPIILSEKLGIILFPTESINNNNCSWFNLSSIKSYYSKSKNIIVILFKNGEKIMLKISYGVLDKQILRSARLENLFLNKKY